MSITTKLHLWWTWMQIAAIHAGMAKRARAGLAEPLSFESAPSAALNVEFQSSLVAIAAVAFAMEALDQELKGALHNLNKSRIVWLPKPNKGFYVAQRLIQVFQLDTKFAGEIPGQLHDLFELRNQSVHFESQTRIGTKPHPSGTRTTEEMTVYTLESGIEAVQLGYKVLSNCHDSVQLGYDPSAASIVRELKAALTMLEEVAAREGISLV